MAYTKFSKSMFVSIVAGAAATLIPLSVGAKENDWVIDPDHSTVNFTVKHLMVSSVSGVFRNLSGTVVYDRADLSKSSVNANISAKSIDTRIAPRDEHLRSQDILDVVAFPSITFKSERIIPEQGGKFKMLGLLTLHGVSREVTLQAGPLAPITKGTDDRLHTGTTASAEINRKDFNVTVDRPVDHGGALVGETIKVNLNISLVRTSGEAEQRND